MIVRLMSDADVGETIRKNLNDLTPRILKVAHAKKIPKMENVIEACLAEDEEDGPTLTDDERIVVAISCLPYLLERQTKKNPHPENYLYQVAENGEALVKEASSPMSPFLIFTEDSDGRVNDILIGGEKEVLLEPENVVSAISSLMFLYYVCNLEYPKQCFNTFLFLQRALLKVFDRVKVPTQVLLLINELYK